MRDIPGDSKEALALALLFYLRMNNLICKYAPSHDGWPEIDGMTRQGSYFGICLTGESFNPTPNQIRRQQEITESHGIYFYAGSIQDLIEHGF